MCRILCLLLFTPLCAAESANAACPPIQPATVQVAAELGAVMIQPMPVGQITARLMASTQNQQQFGSLVDQRGGKVAGTVVTQPRNAYQVEFTVKDTDTERCIQPSSIAYQFSDPQPQLWVADVFPQGSCIAQTTINHEQKHVEVFRAALGHFARRAEQALNQVAALPAISVAFGDENAAYETWYARVNDAVQPLFADYNAEVVAANNAIDNPAEYQAVAQACNGEAARYLR